MMTAGAKVGLCVRSVILEREPAKASSLNFEL